MKTLLSYAVIIGIIGTLWFMMSSQHETILSDAVTRPRGVDAYMKNFSMKAMNEQGQPSMILSASELKHLADSELSELDAPDIRIVDKAYQRWHITADTGTIDNNRQLVELNSNVTIRRIGEQALTIRSETMVIDIDRQLITTDTRVDLTTGATRLNSRGMVIDNHAGTLELLASVRGVHESEPHH